MTAAPPPVVAVHRIAAREPGELVGVSRDGRLVAFVAGGRIARLVVLRLTDRRRRTLASGDFAFAATTLSPDGGWLTFVRHRFLFAVSTGGGRPRRLARLFSPLVTWLDDGRVAVHVAPHEIAAVALDGHQTPLIRGVSAIATISPDARYVLDPRLCTVRLLDRRTTSVRVVAHARRSYGGVRLGPGTASWSPDSQRYALDYGVWSGNCAHFETTLAGGVLVRDVGRRYAAATRSGFPEWSVDGRYLLLVGGVAGTAVTYDQPLRFLDVRAHRIVRVFADRLFEAVAGPNGLLIYGRYDKISTPPDQGPPFAKVRLYTARLRP
jgi:hypothetical protein